MTIENGDQIQDNILEIVKVVPENQNVYTVYLKGAASIFVERKAGQFISIRMMESNGWSQPHSFTISCAPEDSLLSLTISKKGQFTSAISDLKPGTPLKSTGPLGLFCKDIDSKPFIVMMAGGVGITPFLSVLRHFRNTNAVNKVLLFWVNKTSTDVFCVDEINEMTQNLNLTVIHCLSRDKDAQRYFQPNYDHVRYEEGHLTADILKKHGVTEAAAFYLCGPPPMMESTLKELGTLHVDQTEVEQERFSW